ncbi:MAG: asparagine synthase (glutamine-hydrolyzing) [Puniceicoccaceae bacterium]|nr:MAG: asparagine synthase (glutamine-hydrolyzing) [Puniceicoccaceae bacterium]
MCGILGLVGDTTFLDRPKFEKAVDKMVGRGPDGRGSWYSPSAAFGHRRLKILDLDNRSAQPFESRCKRYVLTFNGEIYNFKKLRAELVRKGFEFRTTSDTEVLLYGLVHAGIAFVSKCVGMFAFCFYDQKSGQALLVRDRLGVKPLYYSVEDGRLTFSSQLNALIGTFGRLHSLRRSAIASYLCFRYPIGEETLFEGVFSLAPGTCLTYSNGNHSIQEYWDCRNNIGSFRGSFADAKRAVNNLFSESTQSHLIADVPVGAYLSGGVDSSALVAVSSRMSRKQLSTFSIGFEQPDFNEFKYSDIIADRYNTDHTEIMLDGEQYIEEMEELIHLKGAPLAVPNEIPIFILSKELKKKVTVVLSGEGADELFMGYGRIFRSAYDYRRLVHGRSEARFREKFKRHYGALPGSALDFFINQYSYWGDLAKSPMLSEAFRNESSGYDIAASFRQHFEAANGEELEQIFSYAFIKGHLPGLLQRLDNATMAVGVEGRVPFVDHRLAEFALSLPVRYKLAWRHHGSDLRMLLSHEISEKFDCPKFILKRAFLGILPKEILYRKKLGFPVPLHCWFDEVFRDYAQSCLLATDARTADLFDRQYLAGLFKGRELSENHSTALKVWMMLNLELFLRKFF